MENLQMKVAVIGTGYVGLTTAVCLAYVGHKVVCYDINDDVVRRLRNGQATIHEPGIQELMMQAKTNLHFTYDLKEAVCDSDVIIIAVGTPSKSNGDADLSSVEKVAKQIGETLDSGFNVVIVNKSTVPIGSARRVETVIKLQLSQRGIHDGNFFMASNPEFLREGAAISDTLYPDRIVIGTEHVIAAETLRELYTPILKQTFSPPSCSLRPSTYSLPTCITTNPASSELIKYAANAFLAMKISFINEVAGLAERVGADIREVALGIGLDKRIGGSFLSAGIGWGGSCFGKDTSAIIYLGSQYAYKTDLIDSAVNANYRQRINVIDKIQSILKVVRGRTIGILGLAFKPNTDDLRDAPSLTVIAKLLDLGARVRVYDPVALDNFKRQYSDMDVEYCDSVFALSQECDAIILITEWPEFKTIDWKHTGERMRHRVLVDGRNMFADDNLEQFGFIYQGIGLGTRGNYGIDNITSVLLETSQRKTQNQDMDTLKNLGA